MSGGASDPLSHANQARCLQVGCGQYFPIPLHLIFISPRHEEMRHPLFLLTPWPGAVLSFPMRCVLLRSVFISIQHKNQRSLGGER